MVRCLCGGEKPKKRCCGPLLEGRRSAATPEALVRARYSAFTQADITFLARTYHSETLIRFNPQENFEWAKSCEWQDLDILRVDVAEGGETAEVEFVVRYKQGGFQQKHHELADLRLVDGGWVYYDGQPAEGSDP